MSVVLETSIGDVVVDLFYEETPRTSTNFLKLCKIKYYNDCQIFHIEKGFIVRTGDPTNSGRGGSTALAQCNSEDSSLLEPEFTVRLSHKKRGTVSMIAAASDTRSQQPAGHGSQFFITLADDLTYLDGKHTVFGTVAEGFPVLEKLAETPVDADHRPYRVLRIRHTIVLHDPFEDPKGLPIVLKSPEPDQTVPDDRLPSDAENDDCDGFSKTRDTGKEFQEQQQVKEARSRAEVLEMMGDIGHADLRPPDNVLFVCKINPITEAEDLEIIFSRFGECKADIIRDKRTGKSLNYAFIEFKNANQCEKAYYKMDSALIDDRRIRVDFSQSVSKLWNSVRRGHAMTYNPSEVRMTGKRGRER